MIELLLVIYIVSTGVGLFVRSLILSNQENARQIFKEVLKENYKDTIKANKIVSSLLLFAALVPVINTIYSLVFILSVIRRLWNWFVGEDDGQ